MASSKMRDHKTILFSTIGDAITDSKVQISLAVIVKS